MRERKRTSYRRRATRADVALEERIGRLERPERSYLGVACWGCGCDVVPLETGECPWCGRQIVEKAA